MPTWAVVFITVALTVLAMLLVYRYWFAPKPFDTVELSEREQQQLDAKLDRLMPGRVQGNAGTGAVDGAALEPQAYSEEGVSREVVFNEREVNALLARNTNLSDKLAVDLADDLVSARLLVPLDPEFPFMGGKTVRVHAGMSLSYSDGRPIAVLRGVSIMGVPVPNAWLGGLKNIDLVSEFGGGDGFWKNFADGIDQLRVENGKLSVTLAE
ncbi:MAG: arginine N-succinyltransferase [Pseudomonadales bacterium]|nr:arginine N-succinyltransferase [Gammaproteobacteria bacterium]NNL56844.1 arginine N-succinyltransferase [Pseudomonadales bacterium]